MKYKEFTFLDIPVLGKFDLFTFGLDIDIPTFSLRTKGYPPLTDIGISRNMIKYYNAQFAGSHPFFPKFEEEDILGKKISLVF